MLAAAAACTPALDMSLECTPALYTSLECTSALYTSLEYTSALYTSLEYTSALYTHIVAASEASTVLGADISGALGELVTPGGLLARPWLPHAQGLVAVARVGGVWMLRSRDAARGEKLVFAILDDPAAAPTEAEMLDWELRAVWSSPLPEGHDFEEHAGYGGRAVYLIAPTRLLASLAGYLRLYLDLCPPSRPSRFLCPAAAVFCDDNFRV
jgi:hypothetical protein